MCTQVSVRWKKDNKDCAIYFNKNSSDFVVIHTKRNELDISHVYFIAATSSKLSLQWFNAVADAAIFF